MKEMYTMFMKMEKGEAVDGETDAEQTDKEDATPHNQASDATFQQQAMQMQM